MNQDEQRELDNAKSFLASIVDSSQDSIVTIDFDGVITTWNRGAEDVYGYPAAEAIGRPLTMLTLTEDLREVFGNIDKVKRGERVELYDTVRIHKDGRRIHLEIILSPVKNDRGQVIGCSTIARDVTARREAERALRESEERYRSIINQNLVGILQIDLANRIIFSNAEFARLLGWHRDELRGRSFRDFVHPDDMPECLALLERMVQDQRPFDMEKRLLRRDGAIVWTHNSSTPIRDDTGKVRFATILSFDITSRIAAETSLRESEEQFRRAIEDAPIPVIMHAEDGQVLQISDTWTELTGYTREDIPTFDAWLNSAYGTGAEDVRSYVQSLFRGSERQIEIDLDVKTRSGETRHWAFSASAPGRLRDGRRYIVGMALDITDRRKEHEALLVSEERLRLVVDNARDYAIFSLDLERRVTSWNNGARAILEYSEAEIIGQSADVIFTQEDRAAGQPVLEAKTAIEKGRSLDERWHLRKGGSRFWGSGTMMRMNNTAGEAIGFVKIFRDETEKLRSKEELERSRAELQDALSRAEEARREADSANRAKDQFLAMLSHELRTPLTPVVMTAEAMLKRPDLPERAREGLQVILRNVELETRFINDLLDLTRISKGRLELDCEDVDVHEVLQAAIEISQPDFQVRKQKITQVLNACQTKVRADPLRLQQVFWNVLKNASKFTHANEEISIGSHNEGNEVVVTVRDRGIGIDPSQLKSIFDPFRQGDTGIGRKYGGLGLGLAISKATIDQLGGQISASSEGQGRGTTLSIRLPLRNMQPERNVREAQESGV